MLLEAVVGPFWVWLALGEAPSVHTVIGGAVLIAVLAVHTLLGWQAKADGGERFREDEEKWDANEGNVDEVGRERESFCKSTVGEKDVALTTTEIA